MFVVIVQLSPAPPCGIIKARGGDKMTSPKSFSDDLMEAVTESEIEIECPICGKCVTFTLSDVGSSIKCPHCNEIIELEAE